MRRAWLLVVSLLLTGVALAWPVPAAAHELTQSHGIYGVLHILPDDSPVAGQPATLQLSFGDVRDAFSLQDCDCKLVLEENNVPIGKFGLKPARPGATLNAAVNMTFPEAGPYDILLQGSAKDHAFPDFQLDFDVTVGANTRQAVTSRDRTDAVLLIGATGLLALLVIAILQIRQAGRYRRS